MGVSQEKGLEVQSSGGGAGTSVCFDKQNVIQVLVLLHLYGNTRDRDSSL